MEFGNDRRRGVGFQNTLFSKKAISVPEKSRRKPARSSRPGRFLKMGTKLLFSFLVTITSLV